MVTFSINVQYTSHCSLLSFPKVCVMLIKNELVGGGGGMDVVNAEI